MRILALSTAILASMGGLHATTAVALRAQVAVPTPQSIIGHEPGADPVRSGPTASALSEVRGS